MIQEILVAPKADDLLVISMMHEIKLTLSISSITTIRTAKIYRLEGVDADQAEKVAQTTIADPLDQDVTINKSTLFSDAKRLEVGYKPGVMNPQVATLRKAVQSMGISTLKAADTSIEYYFYGAVTDQELAEIKERLLINNTVEQEIRFKPATLVIEGASPAVSTIAIRDMSDDALEQYAKDQQLFLTRTELAAIRNYFISLDRDPYDAELETIAQTWSEHCCHKTFKSPLEVDGVEKLPLYTRLKQTAKKYMQDTLSAFEDNAGVLRFYDGFAIAGKVETHNSPSAIEPYGGAATGSGGVFRDIMGTGKGARVIASTDIFCFAPPTLAQESVPKGCLHPDYLLRKVVAGVRDYGNRMGVPTNNGSVHFHPDFRAKPSVIVGAYGLIEETYAQKGVPDIGDRIIAVGGKTGRDGIHGATFSSGAMTDQTSTVSSTAVQIGNPIEEKRMADALLAARDAGLINAVTDCGAGGFSSAVGEMGERLGVRVQLEQVPLKYSGLAPWEIWVSESQERMVCAIAPEHTERFAALCNSYNVETADIGYFTGDKKLHVTYRDQTVCNLSMEFLHDGCPIEPLVACKPEEKITINSPALPSTETEWRELFKKIMAHENICSKEPIARQYDHTVQGMNALAAYSGPDQSAPQDAAVMVPLYGKPYGLIVSHGLNPLLNRIDPYAGSKWAIAEAMANLVAVGGNPKEAALIDNFIWPKPDQQFLWALDQSMQACIDAMDAFKIPFISGKDSLSSTYKDADGVALHIPPVLCISAFGKVADVSKTISSDIKKVGSLLLLVGELDLNMGGSVYEQISGTSLGAVPDINLEKTARTFAQLHALIDHGAVLSCHDVSEGGMAAAIAEMCFGGNVGVQIDLMPWGDMRRDYLLFNETAGCFVIEVAQEDYDAGLFEAITHTKLGITTEQQSIAISQLCEIKCNVLRAAWQQPMTEVFSS